MTGNEFLKRLPEVFNKDAAKSDELIFQYNISQPTYVHIKDGVCTVVDGTAEKPNVTLTITDENLIELMTGKLNGMTAFMSGKVKITGDMMLAQRAQQLFSVSKLGL